MKRPRSHQIDDEAQSVLRSQLPSAWVCSKPEKDYAQDFIVETTQDEELTGKTFIIQLKGSDKPVLSQDRLHVLHRIRTHYLAYYADQVELPVFLFLIDVKHRHSYWVFIQQYIDNVLGASGRWRDTSSSTIRIPAANTLRDTATFASAVTSARRYMKSKHPGTIEDAAQVEKKRIESLDERIKVDVQFVHGRVHIALSSRENFQFKLKLRGDQSVVADKMKQIIERGNLVDLLPLDAIVEGFPALEGEGKIASVQFQRRTAIVVRLTLLSASGIDILELDHFRGQLEGGTKYFEFHSSLGRSPAEIRLNLAIPTHAGEAPSGSVGVEFDTRTWCGLSVTSLPYFDQVASLVEHIDSSLPIRIVGTSDGRRFLNWSGQLPQFDASTGLSNFIRILRAARRIASWIKTDPRLPAEMSDEEARDVIRLENLLDPSRRLRPYPNEDIAVQVSRETIVEMLARSPELFGGRGTARCPLVRKYRFLGLDLEVTGFTSVSSVTVIQTTDEMRRWLTDSQESSARIMLRSSDDAVLSLDELDAHVIPN